jgi:hypothetical protein
LTPLWILQGISSHTSLKLTFASSLWLNPEHFWGVQIMRIMLNHRATYFYTDIWCRLNTGYPAGFSTQHANEIWIKQRLKIKWRFLFFHSYQQYSIFLHQAVPKKIVTEMLWFEMYFQLGRISGHIQYLVSGRIAAKSNPLSSRIPDIIEGPAY